MNRTRSAFFLIGLLSLSFAIAGEDNANLQAEMMRADLKTRAASLTEHEMALMKELREGEINRTLPDEKRDNLQKMIEIVRRDREELMKKAEAIARQQPERNNDPDWQDRIRKALDQKVTFEFADVQLNEAVTFIRQIANVNFIVEPALVARNVNITLKAQDMPLRNALDWISRLAEARWEVADHAIFIGTNPPDPRATPAPGDLNLRVPPRRTPRALDSSAKIRVKLPNGAEIETEGGVLNEFPEMMQEILTQLHDTTKDGILVYRLDDPAKAEIVEKAVDLLKNLTVTYTINRDLKLLVVVADQPYNLRRAQVLLNVLLTPPAPPIHMDRARMARALDRDVLMKMDRAFKNPDGTPGQPQGMGIRRKMPPEAAKPPEQARENF